MTDATAAVIALGSNLGDREATIRLACAAIDALDGVRLIAASGLVESHALKPLGIDATAPNYLNAVALVQSGLTAGTLLNHLHEIEALGGRRRAERWGDRTLDLDLITFGELSQVDGTLTLPHPRAWQRPFVLVPWLQIEPDATLVGYGRVDELEAAHSEQVWEFAAPALFIAAALGAPQTIGSRHG